MAEKKRKVAWDENNAFICIIILYVLQGEMEEALERFEDLVKEDHRDFRPYLCQVILLIFISCCC